MSSVFGPDFLHQTLYAKDLNDGAKQSMIAAYAIWNARSPSIEGEFISELQLLDVERDKLSKRVEYFETQEKGERNIRDLNNTYYDTIDLSRVYNTLYDGMAKAGETHFEQARQHAARATMDLIMLQSSAQRMLEDAVGLHDVPAKPSTKRSSPRP